jgi:hypothetical protein
MCLKTAILANSDSSLLNSAQVQFCLKWLIHQWSKGLLQKWLNLGHLLKWKWGKCLQSTKNLSNLDHQVRGYNSREFWQNEKQRGVLRSKL